MFDIQINGKAIRTFSHEGNTFIEGRVGTEYSIKLTNNSSSRRLFVISVDGINVISGKEAIKDSHNGYIINGYDSLNLKGYRINDDEVAAFKFVKSKDSYSNDRTKSTINNGVIGVNVYDEKYTVLNDLFIKKMREEYEKNNQADKLTPYPSPPYNPEPWHDPNPYQPYRYNDTTSYTSKLSHNSGKNMLRACSLNSVEPADFNLGTGWGEKQVQKVKNVEFEVGELSSTSIVYYASKEELEKMGIDLNRTAKIKKTMPSAFGEQKYCPTPKGWE